MLFFNLSDDDKISPKLEGIISSVFYQTTRLQIQLLDVLLYISIFNVISKLRVITLYKKYSYRLNGMFV